MTTNEKIIYIIYRASQIAARKIRSKAHYTWLRMRWGLRKHRGDGKPFIQMKEVNGTFVKA